MSPYGVRLRELLRNAEMSQGELARAVGVLPNHLSQVLSGIKGPFNSEIQERIDLALSLMKPEREELARLASISKTSFRMRRGARPEDYQIVALFSDASLFSSENYLEVARMVIAAYQAEASSRP